MSALDDPRGLASLVILEIGNSHVTVATSVDGRIYSERRFEHCETAEILDAASEAWDALPSERSRAIAAASVVPIILDALREQIEARLGSPVLVVGEDLHRPLSLAVETPETVGIDRICAAAAAYETLGRACVIGSFGTAITIDCVNDQGVFLGGAILPGLQLQARSLHEHTAQLPQVTVDSPEGTYGGSTEEAIRHGVLYGAAGALREITERYATDLKAWPDLVVCGGNAELVSRHTEIIDRVVPDLCLRGIAVAYRKHFAPIEVIDEDA